jgi:hypothetical protein
MMEGIADLIRTLDVFDGIKSNESRLNEVRIQSQTYLNGKLT